ncbi:MAG: hypothetical protein EKK53_23825 [Burkholderiales bacterium]|nr:MAG: hypothetical protein EKK53_23825 [Burkholderiales bacterium]
MHAQIHSCSGGANPVDQRLFIGVYPAGLVYADRLREVGGDYARLAFLPYDTLDLQLSADCPAELRQAVSAHADRMRAKRGQAFQVSTCGQTVILGKA